MKLPVHDIGLLRREVELSPFCPNCSADLTGPGALLLWEYQDQKRYTSKDDSGFRWGTDLPEGGDSYIEIEWHCSNCDSVLVEGGSFPVAEGVVVNEDDYRRLLFERDHARKQIKELQERGNELVEEVRALKKKSEVSSDEQRQA